MQLRFPLPAGYFAKFELLSEEAQSFQSLATDIIHETRRDLDRYIHEGRNLLEGHTWKLTKSKDRLHCYRRRSTPTSVHQAGLCGKPGTTGVRSSNESSSSGRARRDDRSSISRPMRSSELTDSSRKGLEPIVVGYGMLDGTVDDLVYGLYQSSTDEMKTLASFHGDESLIDCSVLKTLRQTRCSHSGLKWRLSRTVGGNRDCCYLDCVGVSEDANGQRFGYHVLESVEVRNCPQFVDKSIVRTTMSFCFIFRPGKVPNQVEVFMEGSFDSSADSLSAGGVGDYHSTMEMFFNLPLALAGAEVKKITAMVATQSEVLRSTSRKSGRESHCSICRAKSSLLSLRTNCETCSAVICSKCRIRKVIFTRKGKTKVTCCKICIVKVKDQSPFEGAELRSQPPKLTIKELQEDRNSRDTDLTSCTAPSMEIMNASVSMFSLTDSELSSPSWNSSSMSLQQSDFDENLYSTSGPCNALVPLDRRMPALLESASQQRQYELQHQEFMLRQQMQKHSSAKRSCQYEANSREGLYNQMLELQMQADRAYHLTNQNACMMYARR
ncbi:hypothetical protein CCR75_005063 [Bremia lactucae]|uniref:FYVE-type domain-containing protein n=1 Tax=Bremia lactucae TaxID=4779 RepID=A0A976P088_BRELC|nr:hypothetical protein CCR75_005063 [Bremia lactucae]